MRLTSPGGGTPPDNTGAGLGVRVVIGGTRLRFESVDVAGMTTVIPLDEAHAAKLEMPRGFDRLPNTGLMIDTSAEFTGSVRVCLDGSSLGPSQFAEAVVLHGISGAWEVQTTRRLCADVTSFSPFAIGVIVDHTPPTIAIHSPGLPTYHVGDLVLADFTCDDDLAGVAVCRGTVDNGKAIDPGSPGKTTFTVQAIDRAGNSAGRSVTYSVLKRARGPPRTDDLDDACHIIGSSASAEGREDFVGVET